jgi:Domain of unknown function (DUF5753)
MAVAGVRGQLGQRHRLGFGHARLAGAFQDAVPGVGFLEPPGPVEGGAEPSEQGGVAELDVGQVLRGGLGALEVAGITGIADVLPSEYANLIGLEAEAAEIRTYQPELIHGLMQTADYARAVIRAGHPGDAVQEVDRRVELRMTRQQILDRSDAPRLRVVLNEAAVRRVVGGPGVMRGQFARLAAGRDRASVSVQVLPFTAGEHPAMASGPFVLLEFPDPADPGVVTAENLTSSLSLDDPGDFRQYAQTFGFLQTAALGPRESADMLSTLAGQV